MLRFTCVLLGLLCIQPASAQESLDPTCADVQVGKRCPSAEQAKLRARYGLADIETLAAEATTVRRAMVNGFNRELVAITFMHAKGQDPVVEIRGVVLPGEKEARSVSAPIALQEWNKVLQAGWYFDRDLVPKLGKNGEKDEFLMCMSHWSATVEATDPSLSTDKIRRKTQSYCSFGLAYHYANLLADTAYDLLPVCHGIPCDRRGGKALALSLCTGLSGDRAVAAEALALLDRVRDGQHLYPLEVARTRGALMPLMTSSASQKVPEAGGGRGASKSQPDELVNLLLEGDVWYRSAKGFDADHAEIEVTQYQRDYAGKTKDSLAPQRTLKMLARRERGELRVEAIDASNFVVVRKPAAAKVQ